MEHSNGISRRPQNIQCFRPGGTAGMQNNAAFQSPRSQFRSDFWNRAVGYCNHDLPRISGQVAYRDALIRTHEPGGGFGAMGVTSSDGADNNTPADQQCSQCFRDSAGSRNCDYIFLLNFRRHELS
jgi:hypothetical protein